MTFDEKHFEECLNDIGCSENEKTEILKFYAENDIKQTINLLRNHRKVTLETIHTQISCLDYFFSLKKIEIRRLLLWQNH